MEVLGIAVPTSSETVEPCAGIWISNHLTDVLNLGRRYGNEAARNYTRCRADLPWDAQVLLLFTNAIQEW